MNLIYGVKQVMHRIRVKLYHNYFPKGEAYIARTDSEATLNIDQVCAALRDRGGFTGDFEDLADYVKQFFNEMVYQLGEHLPQNPRVITNRNNSRRHHAKTQSSKERKGETKRISQFLFSSPLLSSRSLLLGVLA